MVRRSSRPDTATIGPPPSLRRRGPFRYSGQDPVPPSQVKALGAVEALAAVGLVLPGLTGIATVLTPLAAVGVVTVMVGGILVHLRARTQQATPDGRRTEIQGAIVCAMLLVLAAVVAWGRFGPYAL
ncbi:DoxX family protein [Micromonospora sp. NPDC049645]|uniref:DoxX family protein n=1 Tax=Micromonospora sp. NPDC049645 TaxID=3155508 RepID=UPI003428F6D8